MKQTMRKGNNHVRNPLKVRPGSRAQVSNVMIQTMTKPIAAVFIDDANLFYAQKKAGWRIDLKKVKKLLEKEFLLLFVRYYIALPEPWDHARKSSEEYLKKIEKTAQIKTKPLKYIRSGNQLLKKGNVDLELALDVIRSLDQIDVTIIVSGDSDYLELRSFVLEQRKKIIFLSFRENMAWELKQGKYLLLNEIRRFVELGKKTPRNYPGRLLLNILYPKGNKKSRGRDYKKDRETMSAAKLKASIAKQSSHIKKKLINQ